MAFPFLNRTERDLTLLFVTPQRLVRADFVSSPGPTLVDFWQAPAPPGELLPVLVDAALLLGPSRRATVYVVASTVATQFLRVQTSKVGGLEGDELSRALSFEAEALSGLNPFESALGAVSQGESGGERQFWITQMLASELRQIDDFVSRRRGTLGGVLHAGGLPRNVESGSDGDPWQRVEIWNDAVFCVDTSASGNFKLHLIPSPPSRANWQPEADSWFKGCGPSMHRETLVSDPAWLASAGGNPDQSLDDEKVVKTFLTGWAKELLLPRARIPIVRPPPRPIPSGYLWAIGGTIAGAAALVCTAHWFWLQAQERNLKAMIIKAEEPALKIAGLRTQTTALEKQIEIVNEEINSLKSLLEDWKDGVTLEHRRHAALLATLLTNTPPGLMLETIEEKPGDLHLTGISVTPESVGFGTSIAAGLEPFHWTIDPPHRKALWLENDGGPWQLDWSIRPYGRAGTLSSNLPPGVNAGTMVLPN